MRIETSKFVRKPVLVDAVRVTAENMKEVAFWCNGDIVHTIINPGGKAENVAYIQVRVMNPISERQSKAYIGDWVLYSTTGYKAFTDKAFRKSFDPAAEVVEKDPVTEAARESLRLLANNLLALVS